MAFRPSPESLAILSIDRRNFMPIGAMTRSLIANNFVSAVLNHIWLVAMKHMEAVWEFIAGSPSEHSDGCITFDGSEFDSIVLRIFIKHS